MTSTAIQEMPVFQPKTLPKRTNGKAVPRKISWSEFQNRYLRREDVFKYEWVGGQVEKTRRSMDKYQLYILLNLQKVFKKLLAEGKITGELIAEPDLFFLGNHRRPDIAWLSEEQIYRAADGTDEVPAFIIEVISTNDQANRIEKKMMDYRRSGVQSVWHIFPELKIVQVYSGKGLVSMTVREGEEICSAAPGLPGFEITVNDIFYKPKV